MKGMTILDDVVLEQIVGGLTNQGGGGGGTQNFLVSNDSSDKIMVINSNAVRGLLVVMGTQETPLTPLGSP